jgi:hypothetical protein
MKNIWTAAMIVLPGRIGVWMYRWTDGKGKIDPAGGAVRVRFILRKRSVNSVSKR